MCGALFGISLIPNSAPHTHTDKDWITYVATLLNCPRWCILIDYINESNFSEID